MRTLAVGVDLVDVARIAALYHRYRDCELSLVFTEQERAEAHRSRRPERYLAACFGTKESVGKSLGVGVAGIDWCDVSATVRGPGIEIALRDRAAHLASERGIISWVATWTTCRGCLLVAVIGHGTAAERPGTRCPTETPD